MNVQLWNKFHPDFGDGRDFGRGIRLVAERPLGAAKWPNPPGITGAWPSRRRRPRLSLRLGGLLRLGLKSRGFGELSVAHGPFVQLAAGRALGPHRPRTDAQKGT